MSVINSGPKRKNYSDHSKLLLFWNRPKRIRTRCVLPEGVNRYIYLRVLVTNFKIAATVKLIMNGKWLLVAKHDFCQGLLHGIKRIKEWDNPNNLRPFSNLSRLYQGNLILFLHKGNASLCIKFKKAKFFKMSVELLALILVKNNVKVSPTTLCWFKLKSIYKLDGIG